MFDVMSRRDAMRLGVGVGVAGLVTGAAADAAVAAPDPSRQPSEASRPFLTQGEGFRDVSRGNPVPHKLKGDALVQARLTAETWRLEVFAEGKAEIEKPLRIGDGTALDFTSLVKLGQTKGVKFLKAMQCNNIAFPLGQGLWEGVPLREVLKSVGKISNVRRIDFWGFHNNDPKQMFRSTLAVNQVLDTPPGELPPFVAYRLNGEPIPLKRGGPVRMVVPWAHGFKSIKWLQNIALTDDYHASDTYALQNNDPESYLKTAAYLDNPRLQAVSSGKPVLIQGTAMVGWPGLDRVEYWLRPDPQTKEPIRDDDPAWKTAKWQPCVIEPPPDDWGGGLPQGVLPKDVWGFDERGKPKQWPLRFSVALWSVTLKDLKPGRYEFRVRTVDQNGFAQPEPRPYSKSGSNAIQCKPLVVT
jgi:DMSO/TMAO reductase YedYZ molybdopterin-dependent catalytic subunit